MVSQGEIRWCTFPPPDKRRPVVVLTREHGIPHLGAVAVASVTRSLREVPSHVLLGPEDGLREASAVNLDTIQTVRLNTLGPFIAQLSAERMRQVAAAIRYTFDLDTLER